MKLSLQGAVDALNKSYMAKSKNEFQIDSAYGGHKIVITGKSKKIRGKWVYYGLGTACANITDGYGTAANTLAQLAMILSNKDYIKNIIKTYER